MDLTIEFQGKIINSLAKGCDIRQNYRPFQAENNLKIDHLHIHLQPREFEDRLYSKCQIFEKDVFEYLTEKEMGDIIKLLK